MYLYISTVSTWLFGYKLLRLHFGFHRDLILRVESQKMQ